MDGRLSDTGETWTAINKDIYERESSWDVRSEDHFHERFYRSIIADFFDFSPSFRILDLGCGDGFYFVWFARVADAFGQDIASNYAREHLPKELHSRFREGSAAKLQFPDGYFDGVFLNHVIEHIDKTHVRGVVDEICRVLKPSGKLLVATPNRYGLAELFLDITFRGGRRAATGHANIMTPREVRALLDQGGFQVQDILSRSVLCYPSGLDIPLIGRYCSGFPVLSLISRISNRLALVLMSLDVRLTSQTPLLKLGFDIIALARKWSKPT